MKIGLIQVQRFGDLLITLPIAAWFIRQGHEVHWPVHAAYYDAIQAAAPAVKFIPRDPAGVTDPLEFFYRWPLQLLTDLGCQKIFPLYSSLEGADFIDARLAGALKFDEYKYALTGVPFAEKWTLALTRDPAREKALHDRLGITRPYICVHNMASDVGAAVDLPPAWLEHFQIVQIQPLSDNPLDWLYTIEHAAKRIMIDSLYANLVEQLNITGENYLITRSVTAATPVYKNGWVFCWPFDPIPDRESKYPASVPAR